MLKKPQLHADFDHQKFEKFLNPDKTRYNNLDLSRETKVEDPFQDLPDEILLNIFSHLSPYHLAMCSFVNLQFNDISQDWLLWKDFFESNLNLLDFEDLASHYQNKYKITKPLGFFPEKETQNHLTNPNYIPNGNNNNTNTNNNNTNNNTNNINNKISQVSKEKEKEKEKEKQLKKRLTEEPLKFFIEQVHKYQNVKLIYERSDALIKRRTKINNFSRKVPNILKETTLIISLITSLIYIWLKLQWFNSSPWFPFLLFTIVFSVYFFINISYELVTHNRLSRRNEQGSFTILLFMLSIILLTNFTLLTLRLDGHIQISYLTILRMFFIPFLFMYLFVISLLYISDLLPNSNMNPDLALILLQILIFVYLCSFYLFLHFVIKKAHYGMDISWVRVFSILWLTNLSPFIIITALKIVSVLTNFHFQQHINLFKDSFVVSIVVIIPLSIFELYFMFLFSGKIGITIFILLIIGTAAIIVLLFRVFLKIMRL